MNEKRWNLTEAKEKLDQIIEESNQSGPQLITQNSVDVAVVLSVQEFQMLKARKPTFAEYLLSCPTVEDFKIERLRDYPRDIDFE